MKRASNIIFVGRKFLPCNHQRIRITQLGTHTRKCEYCLRVYTCVITRSDNISAKTGIEAYRYVWSEGEPLQRLGRGYAPTTPSRASAHPGSTSAHPGARIPNSHEATLDSTHIPDREGPRRPIRPAVRLGRNA